MDLGVSAMGLVVGFVVGLTGMGGGALMTPLLVLLFHVQPLAAVSSDLVAAVVMKPIGGGVHLKRGTVDLALVKWLAAGSVPSAFVGVLLLRSLGDGQVVQDRIKLALGLALLVASSSMVAKALLDRNRVPGPSERPPVRRLPTLGVGIAGGLIVGMTSVGSGSLMIVLLLALYPRLKASQLVGTDLVQAVPLVLSAAIGHILFGDFELGLTGSLLLGSVPGVYLGAHVSSRANDSVIRPVLVVVLVASSLKLLGVPTAAVGVFLLAASAAAVLVGVRVLRARLAARRHEPVGEPAVLSEPPAR
jgi:uncharacterized membrane protein YfcA